MARWWNRWWAGRIAKSAVRKIETKEQPFEQTGAGMMSTSVTESKPQSEITGFYQNLQGMLQEAIDVKKKTQDAADRITDAIGAPPPSPKKGASRG